MTAVEEGMNGHATVVPVLTSQEVAQLEAHERTIAHGLVTFYEVGAALMAIRAGRLYRETHSTFDSYCRDRWGVTDGRARQLIASARVLANLETVTTVTVLPTAETQARALAPLPPDQQARAWQAAIDTTPGGTPTASQVAAVVQEFKQRRPMAVHYSSATPEWYTPQQIIAAVVDFFDEIDLDPCAEEGEPKTVPATRHFTIADNGLARPWFGRVYLNPPYGDGIGAWIAKLDGAYRSREIEAGIALVPARTDTAWFDILTPYAICFIRGRLKFGGQQDSAPFPSALVYVGDEFGRYARAVAHLGKVFTQHTGEGA